MEINKTERQQIKDNLMKTHKFSKVNFSSANGKNKWSVYLRPKSDRTGVHFHVSYVDRGFISQDEFRLPHKSYYAYGISHPKPKMADTPLGAIREVANLLNDGYKVIKL